MRMMISRVVLSMIEANLFLCASLMLSGPERPCGGRIAGQPTGPSSQQEIGGFVL
jgi:hypothetical protein